MPSLRLDVGTLHVAASSGLAELSQRQFYWGCRQVLLLIALG